MYPPPHHQTHDFAQALRTMQQFSLATVISVYDNDAYITHIPLIYVADGSEYGKLVGHIDRTNPHANLLDKGTVTAVFHGPNTYISPNTYTTAQFPTWNYVKVHIEATATLLDTPDAVKQTLVNMTHYLEKNNENPFVLDYNHPRMDALVNFIVGFELKITKWEGKFKLSQDKIAIDTQKAKEKLIADTQKGFATFINSIFD